MSSYGISKQWTAEKIKKAREFDPTFRLSKSEALKYVAQMGASDSLRGIQQLGAKVFGFDDTLDKLKESDKKLQAILQSKEYGNAALGTFLSSAVIADPIGWIPILGTAKKAKTIFSFAKYGALAGGVHSGMGYVSEDMPGLIGDKQSRLENTLLGVGAGATLGTIAPSTVNAIQKLRGKPAIYGLTKEIDPPSIKIEEDVPPLRVSDPEGKQAAREGRPQAQNQRDEQLVNELGEEAAKKIKPKTIEKALPLVAEEFVNFKDTKIIFNTKTKERFYKGFKIVKDNKFKNPKTGNVTPRFVISIPGEKVPDKAFKNLKLVKAHIDKYAVPNALRNLKVRETNLNNPKLKLNKDEKAELLKSIEVGKSYRDRRVGQLEEGTVEIDTVESLTLNNKKIRKQIKENTKALNTSVDSKNLVAAVGSHTVKNQKEYPFFIRFPKNSTARNQRGPRFKSIKEAQRYVYQKSGLFKNETAIEIHTGAPSKINKGDTPTLKFKGTWKDIGDNFKNNNLLPIENWQKIIASNKAQIKKLKEIEASKKLNLTEGTDARQPSAAYYEGRFNNDPEIDTAIDTIVKENSKEGANRNKKINPILDFYQEHAGNIVKDAVFNNAGASLVGVGTTLGVYNGNTDPEANWTEKFGYALTAGLMGAAAVKGGGRFKIGDELVSEKMSRWFIDDYGLTPNYKLLREDLHINQNSFSLKFLELVNEVNEKFDNKERKLLYNLMTGELDNFKNVSEEGVEFTGRARQLLRNMGQKFLDEKLLSKEVFQKNIKTYLHRSYLKSITDPKNKKALESARQITIIGDQLQSRGHRINFTNKKKYNNEIKKLKEEGYTVEEYQERIKKTATTAGKPFKASVRKNLTKEERIELGEIEDVGFALAETGRLMSQDVATATFFRKISENKSFSLNKKAYEAAGSPDEFIEVSKEVIKGTKQPKYGKLGGMFVKQEVYDDITRMYKIRLKAESGGMQEAVDAFDKMQRLWKLSKTAWNPATHFNNTVSNFLLLDFADTKVEMLVRAAKEMRKGTKSEFFKSATMHNVFDSDVLTRELKGTTKDLGSQVLKNLEKSGNHEDIIAHMEGSSKLKQWADKAYKNTFGKMEDAYQYEDQVFRLAVFIDRIDKGFDPRVAGREAKKWFIDYDINAVGINNLRRTVTPFISYTYRVIPLLAEAAILRPHKFAKWAVVGFGLNEIGKQLGGGNSELERVTMRDELSKKLYGVPFMPPRMVKLGWKSGAGDSQYLDIGRLIPGGDIFDQREGAGFAIPGLPSPAQPGGLLVDIPILIGTKKNPFTGQEIEGLGEQGLLGDWPAIGKAIVQNLTPNVAVLPGSYAWQKMETAIGLEKPKAFYNTPGSKYAAKYTPLEALAFTLGIKLRPQNATVNNKLKTTDHNAKKKVLLDRRKKILRNYRNQKGGILTIKDRNKELDKIELSLLRLAAEWEVYTKKRSLAKAKDTRTGKSSGGLVEGKEKVPFTKEDPAERMNPYTGKPYQEKSKLLNILKTKLERVQLKDGGEATVSQEPQSLKSTSLAGKILEALKTRGTGNRVGTGYTDEEIQTIKDYSRNVALTESDNIINRIQEVKLLGGEELQKIGAGRGKYQFEVLENLLGGESGSGANNTALNRYEGFFNTFNIVPNQQEQNLIDMIDTNLDFSTLNEDQQDAIFYADLAMGKLVLEDLVTGKISHNDAWFTTHYAGSNQDISNKLNERILLEEQ